MTDDTKLKAAKAKQLVEQTRKGFAVRLNQALNEFHDCPPENHAGRTAYLSELFKVSQQNSRRWLKGQHMPESTRLEEVAKCLNIRLEWLMTGKGVMSVSATDLDVRYVINEEVAREYFKWQAKAYPTEDLDPAFEAALFQTVYHLIENGVTGKALDRRVIELGIPRKKKPVIKAVK